MKKTLLHLLASLSIFLLWGCPQPEEPELTPIETEYTIGAGASDFFIKFRTNQDCKVTSDVNWLTVPSTKASSIKTVTISAEANPTAKMRTGHLTISAGSLSAKVTVNQEGNDESFINVSPTSFEVSAEGGTITPNITSNVEYQTIITVDWISQSGDSFVIAKNDEGEGRSAVITLKSGTTIATINVTQAAAGESAVLENAGTATYTVPAEGDVIVVKVRSNVDYEVKCSADWITRTETKSVRVDELQFTVKPNDGDPRTATITFEYGNEMSFGVTVSQSARAEEPYLGVAPAEVHFPAAGGTSNVEVAANYEFTADCDDDWITIAVEDSQLIITADANTLIEGRTAMVMVSSEGMVEYVTVKQDAAESEEDPFDVGSDLSVNGTANCYVVPKPGEFSFDASVMGNGPDGYLWEQTQGTDMHLWPYHREDVYFDTNDVLPSQAFVIWDDNEVITNVVYNAETKRISFTATGNKGNALIGLYDKNATAETVVAKKSRDLAYWSWHIWCTDSPKRFIQYDDKEDDYEILDRNLGATSADPADGEATYGYFYQFGRKDPLKGYDGIAGDQQKAQQELKHSVNHPTYFYKLNTKTTEWFNDSKSSLATVCADLWGNPAWQFCSTANIHPFQALRSELRKTIYDPCPPGYMVPPETCWTGIDAESIVLLDNGVLIPTASGDSFYPFAGYISDLNSWEQDDQGYFSYNGYVNKYFKNGDARDMRVAMVYTSYTSLHAPWDYDHAPNYYGGGRMKCWIGNVSSDQIIRKNLEFESMLAGVRQNGLNVRCVKEFNN
ncbi:MAG: BACON domain-containing protein [Bacteroidales bacterium]|nr:BACON domain-containing protein [Bacteroidales bacterium]